MMDKMKAVSVTGIGSTAVVMIDKPVPKPGEVLVRIKACALCTTEQRVFRGITKPSLPYFGGHEMSGVVVGDGGDTFNKWIPGTKVVMRSFPTCGACGSCQRGYETQCENIAAVSQAISSRSYGMSEYLVLPERQIFPYYSDKLSFVEASISEPIACVIHCIDRAHIDLGDDVVVIGAGIMGMLNMQIAKLKGARVIVAEIDAARREVAKQLGADVVFNPIEENQVEKVQKLTNGRGADVVINTTSIYEVAGQAIQMCARMGRVLLYAGLHPDEPVPIKLGEMHNKETSIIGTVSPTVNDFRRAVKLLDMDIINIKPLIAHAIPIDNAQKAFELATPGTYRVIITMD